MKNKIFPNNLIVCDLKTIVKKDDIVIKEVSSNARKTEHVNKQFARMVECNIGGLTNDIDGWWVDSGATRHTAKMRINLIEFVELEKGKQIIFMGNCTGLDVVVVGTYKLDLGKSIFVS